MEEALIIVAVITAIILGHDRLNGASRHCRSGQDSQGSFLPHGLFLLLQGRSISAFPKSRAHFESRRLNPN